MGIGPKIGRPCDLFFFSLRKVAILGIGPKIGRPCGLFFFILRKAPKTEFLIFFFHFVNPSLPPKHNQSLLRDKHHQQLTLHYSILLDQLILTKKLNFRFTLRPFFPKKKKKLAIFQPK